MKEFNSNHNNAKGAPRHIRDSWRAWWRAVVPEDRRVSCSKDMQRSNKMKTCLLYVAQTYVKCWGRWICWKSCEWLDARHAELSLTLKEWYINGLPVSTTIMLAPLLFAHSSAACNFATYARVINGKSRAKILQTSNKAKIGGKNEPAQGERPLAGGASLDQLMLEFEDWSVALRRENHLPIDALKKFEMKAAERRNLKRLAWQRSSLAAVSSVSPRPA